MAREVSEVASGLRRVVDRLPAAEVRPGQLEMAEAVARALQAGHHVAVAAGTGTGKSLGYLVPAVLSGKRVVVATATKGLQDQLAEKDLPLVAAGLGASASFEWAVLKGRSNYLCRQRLAEMERSGASEQLDLGGVAPVARSRSRARRAGRERPGAADPAAVSVGEEVARLAEWADKTETGERGELDFEPSPVAWSAVSVTGEECPGAHRCPSGEACFAERAKDKAALAQVVVVNHHLLGADLRSGGVVLPEHDALVVDEAHELEDVLATSLGTDVGAPRLRGLAAQARSALLATGVKVTAPVDDVMDVAGRLEQVLADLPEERLPAGLGPELGPLVEVVSARLRKLESELRRVGGVGGAGAGGAGGGGAGELPMASSEPSAHCVRSQLALERCRSDLELCVQAGEETVVWVSAGERKTIRSAPLEVSGLLSELVFSKLPVVLTSATMAPGLAARLGAPPAEVVELDVGSPFDYERHGLIYCAVGLPDRRKPGAEVALHAELESLMLAAGGRTLALFTSRRAMERAAHALSGRFPWPIHVQGDLPKSALVAAFAAEESASLFATMGYWQGVDVPGSTLSLVVIDKLPFPRPDEPLTAARREAAGSAGFRLVDLPRAATLLAQGAGRLIRTADDRGVVAVLDPRLATASYSPYFVRALPRMRRTRDREEALSFLRSIHRGHEVTGAPALPPPASSTAAKSCADRAARHEKPRPGR